MKIIFDHQAFSLQRAGGISRYFYELLRGFRAFPDIEPVTVLGLSSTVWPMKKAAEPIGRVIWFGSEMFSPKATYVMNEALTGAMASLMGRFAIYHNTLYRYMPTIRSVRRVATHHDCIHERFPEYYPNHTRIMRMKARMLRESDLVICVSRASQEDLAEFYRVEPSRTLVVHHGVAPLPRNEVGSAELQSLGLRPFILYVGLRGLYKNFSGLLRAFSRSGLRKDFDLLALGGGALTDEERMTASQLGAISALRVVPHSSNHLLAEAYAKAAVFVYPSLYEGFGMPPLEAMKAGCPTLVARTKATLEVCGDASTFFDPENDEEFSDRLSFILSDGTTRRGNVERGLARAATYTWEEAVRKTVLAYRSIL